MARDGISRERALQITWALEYMLGRELLECGKVEEAIASIADAVTLIEMRRTVSSANPLARARHFALRVDVYRALINALVTARRDEDALAVAEQMTGRSLDDMLSGVDEHAFMTGDDERRERALNQQLVAFNRAFMDAPADRRDGIRKERQAIRGQWEDLLMDRAPAAPDDPSSRVPPDPLRSAASAQSTVIEYVFVEKGLLAFVISNGHLSVRRLPAVEKEIGRRAAAFVHSIETRDLRYAEQSRALYEALIEPLADLLPHSGTLTIVPDHVLWSIPFAALLNRSNVFLAERHAVVYAPSLTAIARLAHRSSEARAMKTLLALANPTGSLPDAENEARTIGRLYGAQQSTVLTGNDASESVFERIARDYRIVHLATHGFVDEASPLYAALLLARRGNDDDGLLEMREVRSLHLNADVVVLSACDTGNGTLYPGEGVVGMAWAFLSSGCPTVVVSRWQAQTRATANVMVEFHRRLREGIRTAEALREAQMNIRHMPRYAHPYYWAPFIVVGRN